MGVFLEFYLKYLFYSNEQTKKFFLTLFQGFFKKFT